MFLQSVSLQNFRNHVASTWRFHPRTTLIVGQNAQGKTSIIEAVNLLATGNSFRADRVEEMITFDQELARVKGLVELEDDTTELEIMLTRGLVQGKKTALRLYSVNQVRRRKKDFTSNFTTVVFRPEDMRLVEGSPSRRRGYLDAPLSLVDQEYDRALTAYEKTLQRRNKLLISIREGEQSAQALTFWNMSLVKHGEYVHRQRQAFLNFCSTVEFPMSFSVVYDSSPISLDRIEEYQGREIASGHTLIGPHKDDLSVEFQVKSPLAGVDTTQPLPVATYGSRGQQRLAVLWLKMCEFEFLKQKTGQVPLLLLDDILSELDNESRDKVLSLLHFGQSIITTTEPKIVEEVTDRTASTTIISL